MIPIFTTIDLQVTLEEVLSMAHQVWESGNGLTGITFNQPEAELIWFSIKQPTVDEIYLKRWKWLLTSTFKGKLF